jgi:hypothetical protein
VWDENSVSNAAVTVIPSQHRVTHQILGHWYPFRDLKLMFTGSRRAEQLHLCSQQHIVATVDNSVLRTEMTGLESKEEDVPKRILFFKTMSWLGHAHLVAKKPHDWVVDQLADLFRTTHRVKTQHVTKNRGRYCGDIDLTTYLPNLTVPVPLVLDLRITHDRFGINSDLNLNGHLNYPNDIDRSLNETGSESMDLTIIITHLTLLYS